jgi:hypothetical protein
MICESYYWRKKLIKISKKISKKITVEKNWSESKRAKFEQEIMVGFYIIRKLMEANKLDNKLCNSRLLCKVYPSNHEKIMILDRYDIFNNYDFKSPKFEKHELKFFINQFVHSYLFIPIIDIVEENSRLKMDDEKISDDEKIEIYHNSEKALLGIFVNSDTNKNKSLFEIDIKEIISIFQKVGNCVITKIDMKFNPKKGDFDSIQYDERNKLSEEAKMLIAKKDP